MSLSSQSANSARMPVLFIGHGSPMNAVEKNDYTAMLENLGEALPRPHAILMISAHWMTRGTGVTHMKTPKTIHDFSGFPDELFAVQYPAPGSPELAEEIQRSISNPQILFDDDHWGFDHGAWAVLKHMYPKADIPVVQLSLDMTKPIEFHYEMGKKLRALREQGVLILGSGNIVHNLRRISWEPKAPIQSWAQEFDQWVKQKIDSRDFAALVHDATKSEAGKLSIPTPDHYYPLLYILGASLPDDKIKHVFEEIQNSSIAMRSIQFG